MSVADVSAAMAPLTQAPFRSSWFIRDEDQDEQLHGLPLTSPCQVRLASQTAELALTFLFDRSLRISRTVVPIYSLI